ncbi:MAG: hypothetical protein NTV01_22545 [Bacteroidia bacterium]|nr:hypothetical protein [Bacteroidia bacterium]
MELRIDVDYNQILRLIHQLPKREIEKLTNTLQIEMASKKTSNTIQKMILNAPTWSDSDLNDFNEARNHINKSRIA